MTSIVINNSEQSRVAQKMAYVQIQNGAISSLPMEVARDFSKSRSAKGIKILGKAVKKNTERTAKGAKVAAGVVGWGVRRNYRNLRKVL